MLGVVAVAVVTAWYAVDLGSEEGETTVELISVIGFMGVVAAGCCAWAALRLWTYTRRGEGGLWAGLAFGIAWVVWFVWGAFVSLGLLAAWLVAVTGGFLAVAVTSLTLRRIWIRARGTGV